MFIEKLLSKQGLIRKIRTLRRSQMILIMLTLSLSLTHVGCLYDYYYYIPVPNRDYMLYHPDDTLIFIYKGDTSTGIVSRKNFEMEYGELFSEEYTEKGSLAISDASRAHDLINIEMSPEYVSYRFYPDSSLFPDELVTSHIVFNSEMKDGQLKTNEEKNVYILSARIGEGKNVFLHLNTTEGIKRIFVPGYDTLKISRKR